MEIPSFASYNKTSTYHTNGNNGLIVTSPQDNKRPYFRYKITDISNLIGKTILFSCDVKSLTDLLNITIYQNNGNNYSVTKTEVPANTENSYNVTTTVANETVYVLVGIEFKNSVNQGASFYTDNWRLCEIRD